MSKNDAVREFIKAVVVFRKAQGQTVIPRKVIFEALNREDPRDEYGSGPIGADLTVELMESIATELGGIYTKDANGRNARFEFV
jgi:hypothetical protein